MNLDDHNGSEIQLAMQYNYSRVLRDRHNDRGGGTYVLEEVSCCAFSCEVALS